nr:META domain-containing protein [uncultured Desulfobacter sp.]
MPITKRIILMLGLLLCAASVNAADKDISVKLTVPDTTWTIAISEVHKVGNELWVISIVSQTPDVMGAQVISTVQASLKLAAPNLPVKMFIIGKTWNWENLEPYTFINDLKGIDKELKSGKRIYPAGERSTDPKMVLNKTWLWESTTTPVQKIEVAEPGRYTILFGNNGNAQARFDCNKGGGSYEISEGKISFGPLMSTRMACPEDSMDGPFMRDLQQVVSFFIDKGYLFLELPYDSGTMKFRAAP